MQVVVSKKSGKVLCVHAAKGSCHDFQLFKQSRLPLARALKVLTDSGYQGIKKLHANSVTPIKAKRGEELSALEKIYNSVVSKCRIYIEHINRYIKRFRIFSSRYRNRRKKFALRFSLICGIYNFQHG